MLVPNHRSSLEDRTTFEQSRHIAISDRVPLPAVGSVVELPRRMETFRGQVAPGPVEIAQSGYDHYGIVMVNLSRKGQIIAQGVQFPFAENAEPENPIRRHVAPVETKPPIAETKPPREDTRPRGTDANFVEQLGIEGKPFALPPEPGSFPKSQSTPIATETRSERPSLF